jgi:predicted DCC family thiol-disulfide oxidoreductase YuxK
MVDAQPPEAPGNGNWLLYDGDCPFCSRYVTLVRLRESVGPIKLADARENPALVGEVTRLGYDVDEGMILKLDGRYYYGADCINMLALLTTPSGAFNRLNRAIFRSSAASAVLYPILRAGRNATLRLLGRRKLGASPAE